MVPTFRRFLEVMMAIYIYEGNALTRMTVVEGANWARQQEARPDNPYGFYAFLAEWLMLQEVLESDEEWEGNLDPEGGDGAIYGQDGMGSFVVTVKSCSLTGLLMRRDKTSGYNTPKNMIE